MGLCSFATTLYSICEKYDYPHFNAIGFWYALIQSVQNDKPIDFSTVNTLLMCTLGSYGDLFEYAVMRLLSPEFVYPDETSDSKHADHQKGLLDRARRLSPELTQSVAHFYLLKRAWNKHLKTAQNFAAWRKDCDTLHYANVTGNVNLDAVLPLARIFRQYIALLSAYSNSTHADFGSAWRRFESNGNEDPMAVIFQCISDTLTHEPKLAQIAPAYVLKVFQSKTKQIYGESSIDREASCIKLTDRMLFDVSSPLLDRDTSSNKKIPRKISVILYGILREYYREQLGDTVNLALSDYIFERSCSLLGQTWFLITQEMVKAITDSAVAAPFSVFDFEPDHQWVHPLLQQCSERLEKSLALYENSVPNLSYGSPSIEEKNIIYDKFKQPFEKGLTNTFIDQYQEILLNGSCGLGSHKTSNENLEKLASLFDEWLLQFPEACNIVSTPDGAASLAAIEQLLHLLCMTKVSKQAYKHILFFLYQWFYSESFALSQSYHERLTDELMLSGMSADECPYQLKALERLEPKTDSN